MNHRVVVIQSNYIPWKGYFDMLSRADTVVLFDAVQSTKNDWRNRNQIKTSSGKQWLTIPIRHSTAIRVRDVEVANRDWHRKHFRTLSQAYADAPHAPDILPILERLYAEAGELTHLAAINRIFIRAICERLGIGGRFIEVESLLDDERHDSLEPSRRLAEICRQLGATAYLTGPAARSYLDTAAFEAFAIEVEWFDYDGYPEYPQLHGSFDHAVSIVDLLLMTGPGARRHALRKPPAGSAGPESSSP